MKLHLVQIRDKRLFSGMWIKRGGQTGLVCLILLLAGSLEAQELGSSVTEEKPPPAEPHVSVDSTGACPSQLDVVRELQPLLSKWEVATENQQADAHAQVDDLGDSFRIKIQGETRDVENSPTDCRERARVAAVVIAMQLETSLGSAPPVEAVDHEEPPEEAPEANHTSPNELKTSRHWELQASLLVGGGFEAIAAIGLGPRVSIQLSTSAWLLRLSTGVLFFSRADLDERSLAYMRFPTDLAVGRMLQAGDLRFSPSLALALDPFRVEAPDLGGSHATVRLDVGARLGFQVAQTAWPLRPSLELQASWFPRNFELYVAPEGELGRTPNFWWGVGLGGSFALGEQGAQAQ